MSELYNYNIVNPLGKKFSEKGTHFTYYIERYDVENNIFHATDNLGNSCVIYPEQIGTLLTEIES